MERETKRRAAKQLLSQAARFKEVGECKAAPRDFRGEAALKVYNVRDTVGEVYA